MPPRPRIASERAEDVAHELSLLQSLGFCTLAMAVSGISVGFTLLLSLPHSKDQTQAITKALTASLILIGSGYALAKAEEYWPYMEDSLNTFFGGNRANRRPNTPTPTAPHTQVNPRIS